MKKEIRFKEDKSWQSPLPDGSTLHRIDVFVGNNYIDDISVTDEYLKYFVE